MEHFKSTIATAAMSAFGLYAAAHILHPGNFERTTYPSRPVAAVASQDSAWVSPPATLPALAPAPTVKAEAPTPVPAPVAWSSANPPAPAKTAETSPDHRRKAGLQRRKLAQRPAPVRQAALDNRPRPPAATSASKAPSNRIDPIGDIIRGLGLGSDS